MDRRHVGRQAEAGAPLAVARALHRRIHRQHQCLEAGGLGTPHQCEVEAAVALQVELEPQRPALRVVAHRTRHVFERRARLRAQYQPRALCRGGECAAEFALRMRHPLVRHRREQQRMRQRAAEQFDARVSMGQRPQHARLHPQGIPGLAVGAQRGLVGRAAGEVGPGVRVQRLARTLFVVADRHRRRFGGAHVSAQARRRL